MELFSIEALFTLLMLVFLQAVLGFDNLLYISIESKRVAKESQQFVRRLGIGLAIILRIVLLVVVVQAISMFQNPFVEVHQSFLSMEMNVHALIVLVGGVFIIYTAFKEIMHMLSVHDVGHDDDGPKRSVAVSVTWIVIMNLVFSFDSILSAIALTGISGAPVAGHSEAEAAAHAAAHVDTNPLMSAEFAIMALAIVISGILMIVMADQVSEFLKRNRLYEVLGLFILLIVGIMLTSEGGHLAHLSFFGYPVEAMSKTTFYFSIAILVLVDVAQGRYQKKLDQERAHA